MTKPRAIRRIGRHIWPGLVLLVASLLSAAVAVAAIRFNQPGQRWAVIIAVDRTTPESAPAAVEAIGQDLAATLRMNYGYENIVQLMGPEATADNILRLRSDLQDKIKSGDSVLIVAMTEWSVLPSGGTALMPADAVPSQSWTMLSFADVREVVGSINAASVVTLLDRCGRRETMSKGGKGGGEISRSPAVIVSGCVRSSPERGQFIKRVNEALQAFRPETPDSVGQALTLTQLLDQVTMTRSLVDIETDNLGGGPLTFAFTRADASVDASLAARVSNRSGNPDRRLEAIETLAGTVALEKPGSSRLAASAMVLEKVASDGTDDEAVRITAVRELGRLKHAGSAEAIRGIVDNDGNPATLRVAALQALVAIGGDVAHDAVMKSLSASDIETRISAVKLFRTVARSDDTPRLMERLRVEQDDQPLVLLVQTAVQLDVRADKLVPGLHGFIEKTSSDPARREAIRALGRLGSQRSYELLANILGSESQPPAVRQDAVYAIGKLNFNDPGTKAQAAELVARAAKQQSPGVRSGVAATLGRLRVTATRPTLELLARDKESSVREVAAFALGQFGDAASVPVLERALAKDPSTNVRREAARSLGEIGSENAVAPLAAAVNDPDPLVRRASAEALKRLEGESSVEFLTRSIARSRDSNQKARAIRLLPARDDSKVIAALVASLEDDSPDVREAAVERLSVTPGMEVVRQLAAALSSKDDDIRAGAVMALGYVGARNPPSSPQWQEAFKALSQMPYDSDTDVRIWMARSAGNFADPAALTIILKHAGDTRSEIALAAADGLRALAASYSKAGDAKMAIDAGERALELRTRLVGERHRETATDYNNLGAYYLVAEDPSRAEYNLERSLVIRETLLGAYDLDTAVSLANLGSLYQRSGDLKRAEQLYLRVLTIRERSLDPTDPAVIQSLENLSGLYRAIGDQGRADKYDQRAKMLRQSAA